MINPFTNKRLWLVYQLGSSEQSGSGWNRYWYYCIAEGDTEDEAILNWAENVKTLYNVELKPKKNEYGDWESFYPIVANELPYDVFGTPHRLDIIDRTEYYRD